MYLWTKWFFYHYDTERILSQTKDSLLPVWTSRMPSPFVVLWIRPELLGFMRGIEWAADLGQRHYLFRWSLYLNDIFHFWSFSSIFFFCTWSSLLTSSLVRISQKQQSCKPCLCTEARAVAPPSAIAGQVSLGKIITSRVNFFKAILKSVMKSKQTDVGFYSRQCQELVFHQLRYQITVKTECFRNQTSSLHSMHLPTHPTDNYHQAWENSKGVIHDSPSWRNRPLDTPEHPC